MGELEYNPNARDRKRSPFGIVMAKLRVDMGVTQEEQARLLDFSAAYLSKVEWGNTYVLSKNVFKWVEMLVPHIPEAIREQYQTELMVSVFKSCKIITIATKDLTEEQRSLVALFAYRLPSLSEDQLNQIQEILKPST